MIEVLEVRADGTAIVSTAGLRRVVDADSGEILDELLEPGIARAFVRTFNRIGSAGRAKSIDYAEVYRGANVAAKSARKPTRKKPRSKSAK